MYRSSLSRIHQVIAIVHVIASCGGSYGDRDLAQDQQHTKSRLTLRGSDTMVMLSQKLAEGYGQIHKDTIVQVSGGGTGTGMAALASRTADIATASRAMKPTERERIQDKLGTEPTEVQVAVDAIAIYVHPDNPVRALSLKQLKAIYRGQITRWRQVGGLDRPIVLYSRENNSGTYAFFKEHVLTNEDFAAETQTLPGTAAVVHAVSQDQNSIGYGGISQSAGVRILALENVSGRLVTPSYADTISGAYPVSRPLFMYTTSRPGSVANAFLSWVISDAGQSLIERIGFYPLPKDVVVGQSNRAL